MKISFADVSKALIDQKRHLSNPEQKFQKHTHFC